MRKYFLGICLFAMGSIAVAQRPPCGTERLTSPIQDARIHDLITRAMQENAQKTSGTIVIPTVFHVVYNSPAQNIPDSLIHQQLRILNDDFRRKNADTVNTPAAFQAIAGGMDIEFCLAQRTPAGAATTGIVRVATNTTVFNSPTTYSVPDPVKHTNLGGSDAWDTDRYLNIWACNLDGSTAYSAPPGNFMPDDEGIVCRYEHVGNTGVYPYNHGRTIVHEAGHYFCLKHIWGDDQGACTGTDYINDTPNQANYSTNCPNFPKTDACSPNSPGVMYMNYMDYSEDACRNMFTTGQCAYMLSCLTSLRPGLLTSDGCLPVVGVSAQMEVAPSIVMDGERLKVISPDLSIEFVELVDMQGKVARTGQAGNEAEMWLGGLSHGIYCVRASFAYGQFRVWKLRL